MLPDLKERVLAANLELHARKLVIYTWGNVSGIDRKQGLVVIKPSGVPCEELSPDKMVVLDLERGHVVDGYLRPSSDAPAHLVLYRNFPEIGGVVHTHSPWATAWAQANAPIPCLGTTHADHFYGPIPCTRQLTQTEVESGYVASVGLTIVEAFRELDYRRVPGVLVASHGPFCWGKDVHDAVYNAVVLEEVAKIAYASLALNPACKPIPQVLLDRHYMRKHGDQATYGQKVS